MCPSNQLILKPVNTLPFAIQYIAIFNVVAIYQIFINAFFVVDLPYIIPTDLSFRNSVTKLEVSKVLIFTIPNTKIVVKRNAYIISMNGIRLVKVILLL